MWYNVFVDEEKEVLVSRGRPTVIPRKDSMSGGRSYYTPRVTKPKRLVEAWFITDKNTIYGFVLGDPTIGNNWHESDRIVLVDADEVFIETERFHYTLGKPMSSACFTYEKRRKKD